MLSVLAYASNIIAFFSFNVNKGQVMLRAVALHSRVSAWMFASVWCGYRDICASPTHLKSDSLEASNEMLTTIRISAIVLAFQ